MNLVRYPARLLSAAAAYAVGLSLFGLGATYTFPTDTAQEALIRRIHDEGPLALLIRVRTTEYLGRLFISSVSMFNWQVMALFFVGAVVMRNGLLAPERIGLHRRVALIGGLSGLALELLMPLFLLGDPPPSRQVLASLSFSLGSVLLASGYVGVVLWSVHARLFPRLQQTLAAVSRTALTNYLAQSVLMNLLFYWFGLGLFGQVCRMGVLGIVSALFVLQMTLSVLWLRRYRMGPIGWVWRRLTYGRGVTM